MIVVVIALDDVTAAMTEKLHREVMRVATRVGEEAGAVMMIADTHAVTEEEPLTATTTAAGAAAAGGRGVGPAPPTAVATVLATTVTTATAIVAAATVVAVTTAAAGHRTTTAIMTTTPSVRPHRNLLKMNGIAALSLSSSSPPAFAPAN